MGTETEAHQAILGILAAESAGETGAEDGAEPKNPPTKKAADAEEQSSAEMAESMDSQSEEEGEQPEKKSRRVKAKLADQEVEFDVITEGVDPDLVKNGLMMQSDYSKKTSELAAQRSELEQAKVALAAKMKDIEADLLADASFLDSEEGRELLESDPEEYYRERAKLERKAMKHKQHREALEKDLAHKRTEMIRAEQAKWKETHPSWLDEKVMQKDLGDIAKLMADTGFSKDEIGGVYDARLIKVLHKAALYDRIASTDVTGSKQKTPAKKVPAGSKAQSTPNDAFTRLRKTGSNDDAVAAIKALL